MSGVILVSILMSVVVGVSTPILPAALGELVVEKSGFLNLGVEGMMLIGAISGFAVNYTTGSPWIGVIAAAFCGTLAALLFGFLTLTLTSNQIATGLALTIFGISLSPLVGESFTGLTVPPFGPVFPDALADNPLLRLVLGHSPIVYFSILMTFAVRWFLGRTRSGLILRAVGENDHSAHSIGYPVIAVRYAAVAFGGAMAGIAGSFYSMTPTPMWAEQLTAGRGWIALALVVFALWRPWRLFFGACLFGLVMTLELQTKAAGYSFFPPEFTESLPYLATIAVLAAISMRKALGAAATLPLVPGIALARDGPLKVGFVYIGPVGDFGWTYAHEQGRLQIVEELGGAVETTMVENVAERPDAERIIRQLAQDGNRLIFTTSFGHLNPTIEVARQFPGVYFEHATGLQRADNVATYNARFHEGRAVIGTIGGMMSEAGTAGFIASFPIPEVVMGINPFRLAARKVNPDFKTNVVWVSTWHDPAKEADAARALMDQGADMITRHTDSPDALQAVEERGVYAFGQASNMSRFAPNALLTATEDHWGPYCVKRAQAVLDGTWESTDTWAGMADGEVAMSEYRDDVPEDVKAAALAMEEAIKDGSFHPFTGPIHDQEGELRVPEGETMTDEQLAGEDWFIQRVVS